MDVSYTETITPTAKTPSTSHTERNDGLIQINGDDYKGVMLINAPDRLPGYDIEMELNLDQSDLLTGTLCLHCTPTVKATIPLTGVFDNQTRVLLFATETITQHIHTRTITRTVHFAGELDASGVVSGVFTNTLSGYIGEPMILNGLLVAAQLTGSDVAAATKLDQAPVTVDDHFVVAPGSIDNQLDLLANDTDPDGKPGAEPAGKGPQLAFVGQPNYGHVQMIDNQVEYTPPSDFLGEDTFHYVATDGRLFAVGQATVEVTTGETFVYLPLIKKP